jgi:hypothetical protein
VIQQGADAVLLGRQEGVEVRVLLDQHGDRVKETDLAEEVADRGQAVHEVPSDDVEDGLQARGRDLSAQPLLSAECGPVPNLDGALRIVP